MHAEIEHNDSYWRLRLTEEILSDDYSSLEAIINDAVTSGAEKLVVDLSGVDFLASSVIGVLVDASARLTEKGCHRIVLLGASKQVRDVIRLLFPPERFFAYASNEEDVENIFASSL